MKGSTHLNGNSLHNTYGHNYIDAVPASEQPAGMIEKLRFPIRGMLLGLFGTKTTRNGWIQNSIKMRKSKFAQQLDIQQTLKYGAILYIVAAMVALPAGICSSSYQTPMFEFPIVAPIQSSDDFKATTDKSTEPSVGMLTKKDDLEAAIPAPPPYHRHIMKASEAYDVDAALIRAIIVAESSYNPRAVSHRGALGLMQLMPTTARSLGVQDAFDPALNIDGGVRYFRRLLDRFDGDVHMALAAYNAGSRYVRKYGGVPPFRETRTYIKKVLKYRQIFQEEMAAAQNYPIIG